MDSFPASRLSDRTEFLPHCNIISLITLYFKLLVVHPDLQKLFLYNRLLSFPLSILVEDSIWEKKCIKGVLHSTTDLPHNKSKLHSSLTVFMIISKTAT